MGIRRRYTRGGRGGRWRRAGQCCSGCSWRKNGRITNREYQVPAGITDRTALRDFDELMAKGVLAKRGTTGRSIHYVLRRRT